MSRRGLREEGNRPVSVSDSLEPGKRGGKKTKQKEVKGLQRDFRCDALATEGFYEPAGREGRVESAHTRLESDVSVPLQWATPETIRLSSRRGRLSCFFFFCSRRFSSRRERHGFSFGQRGCCFSSAVVVIIIIIIIAAAITAALRVLRGLSCVIHLLSPFFSSSRRQKSVFLMLCSKF